MTSELKLPKAEVKNLPSTIGQPESLNPLSQTALSKIPKLPCTIVEDTDLCNLFTPEEIQKHSLLKKRSNPEDIRKWDSVIQKMQNRRTFYDAIIHLGALAAGGGLATGANEGMDPIPNFELWIWFLNDLIPNFNPQFLKTFQHIQKGLNKFLVHSIEMEHLQKTHISYEEEYQAALNNSEKIKQLQVGDSEQFLGGYNNGGAKNSRSHAQLYEIIRNNNGTFDLHFFTSKHFELADTQLKGTKIRINPIVHFQQIPENVLLHNRDGQIRPFFLGALTENCTSYKFDYDRTVSDKHVLRIFDFLQTYCPPIQNQECGTITGQRTSNCMLAVTKAWIRRHVGQLSLHKQIMFHFKLKILIHCHQSLTPILGDNTSEGEKARQLLVQIARNIMRGTAKLIGQNALISPKCALEALITAQDCLDSVATLEKKVKQERMDLSVKSDLTKISVLPQRQKRMAFSKKINSLPANSFPSGLPLFHSYHLENIGKENAKALLQAINFTQQTCNQIEQNGLRDLSQQERRLFCFRVYNQQIHHLIDQIPLPHIGTISNQSMFKVDQFEAEFWKDFSLEDLKSTLLNLNNLLVKIYLPTKSVTLESLSRRFATILPLYVLTHFLTLKIEAKSLSSLPSNKFRLVETYQIPNHLDALEMEALHFLEKNEFDRIQQAADYIKGFNATTNQPPLFKTECKTEVNKNLIEKSPSNGKFWEALIDHDSSLAKLITQLGESLFPERTPEQIENDYQLMSRKYEKELENHEKWREEKKSFEAWAHYREQETLWKKNGSQGSPPKPPTDPLITQLRPEPKPEPAKRKVNLTPLTKSMLALGKFDSTQPHLNILNIGGYQHLYLLRYMTYIYRQMLYFSVPNMNLQQVPKQTSPYDNEAILEGVTELEAPSNDLATKAWENHRTLKAEHINILRYKEFGRHQKNWDQDFAESRVLTLRFDSFIKRILRLLSQPLLLPDQMIFELSREFKRLQDPSLQGVLLYLFLRTPVLTQTNTDKTYLDLSAANSIVSNQCFFDNSVAFINKGLIHSLNADKTLSTALFFFELSFFLCKFLTDAKQYEKAAKLNQLLELERWLDENKFNDQERSTLNLYKVCFLSLRPLSETPSEAEAADIFASWLLYKLNSTTSGIWRSQEIERCSERFINIVAAKISKNSIPQYWENLGSLIFSKIKLENSQNHLIDPWMMDPVFKFPYIRNSHWKISLTFGKIYNDLGELQGITGDCPWERSKSFERIFKNEKGFLYRSIGKKYVLFNHPKKGTFRLFPSDESKPTRPDYIIQTKLAKLEGWFQYCPLDTLKGKQFPNPLIYDHAYWIPQEGIIQIQNYQIKGLITSLKTHKIRYAVLKNGEIVEANEATGAPIPQGYRLDYLTSNLPKCLEGFWKFDNLKNIVTYRDVNDQLDKIVLKRYTSLEGNPLMFLGIQGRYVFSDNRDYVLPQSMPRSLLGTIENYIFLESIKDPNPLSGLLIVPFQNIELPKKQSVIAEGKLQITPPEVKESTANKITSFEWNGIQKYFVYKVDNRKVEPTTTESTLFLAYIRFSQKEPEEAIRLLRSIRSIERFSSISIDILNRIQDLPIVNDHPDLKMVKLQALALKLAQRDRLAKEPIENYFKEKIEIERLSDLLEDLNKILQGFHNISYACRLPKEEEIYVLNILEREINKKLSATNVTSSYDRIKQRLAYLRGTIDPQISNNIRPGSNTKSNHDNNPPLKSNIELVEFVNSPPKKEDKDYIIKKAIHEKQVAKALSRLYFALNDFDPNKLSCYPYTRPPANANSQFYAKLFLEVLYIVKNGSQETKNEMIFRLKLWRGEMHKANDYLECAYLILLYQNYFLDYIPPSIFEKVVNENDYDLKYANLRKIQVMYNQLASTSPKIELYKSKIPFPIPLLSPASYSLPAKDPLEIHEKKLSDIAPDKISLKIRFDTQDERWSHLNEWKSYLKPDQTQAEPIVYEDFDFRYVEGLLSPTEKVFEEPLKNDLEIIQADYNKGKEINSSIVIKTLPEEKLKTFKEEIQNKLTELTHVRKKAERELHQLANYGIAENVIEQALIGGKVKRTMDLQDCLDGLLAFDQRHYLRKNPFLKDKSNEVATLTLHWVDLKSYEKQLNNIVNCLQEIEEVDQSLQPDLATRRSLCRKLEDLLDGTYHFQKFDDETQACLRIFCGQTGNIPYKVQADLIEKMLELEEQDPQKYKNIIVQLIMGGGKTSVIATLILYLAAKRKGRIGFFVVPLAHFNTFSANFSDSIGQAFGKEVLALNLSRQDFSLYNLQRNLKLLKNAQEEGTPVILTPVSLQGMDLEELSLSRRIRQHIRTLSKTRAQAAQESQQSIQLLEALKVRSQQLQNDIFEKGKKVQIIAEQLTLTAECADNLLDEVDQILAWNMKLTYVDGKKIAIDPLQNQLLHTIYSGLCHKTLQVETLPSKPLLKDFVKVCTNSQTLLTEENYLEHVLPAVARYLSSNFKPFTTHLASYGEAFVRYTSGKIPPILQKYADQEQPITKAESEQLPELQNYSSILQDIAFLKHLKNLNHGSIQQKEASDLIADAKNCLQEVVKTALKKVGGRNYGQAVIRNLIGKIIPYRGVNAPAPANNEFGNHLMAVACHYQWGAAFKPTEEQILKMTALYTSSANHYVEKNGERFEATAEYLEFRELFNVKLDEINDPGKLQEAIAFISLDTDKLLDMQFELISQYATFATESLSNDGLTLLSLCSSNRGMSGTPGEVEGYGESLAKRYFPSVGTEGRIFHESAKRVSKKKIYEIDFRENDPKHPLTIRGFLNEIDKQHRDIRRLRAIADSGGLFKDFGSNADVAKAWMDFIQEKQRQEREIPLEQKRIDPRIEAVLFYHTDAKSQTDSSEDEYQSNTLYVFRKGSLKPEKIVKSTYEALKELGLTPEKYVLYIDERHKEGTDIRLVPNALGLETYDGKLLLRSDAQTKLRWRGYLLEQDVEIVVSKETRSSLFNQAKQERDIVLQEAAYQSKHKALAMVRYFTEQVNHIFRHQAVLQIRKANLKGIFDENYADLVDKYEQFFTQFNNSEPFKQHGRLEGLKDTKEALKDLLKNKLTYFKKFVNDPEVIQAVEQAAAALEKWIDQSKSLPKLWKDVGNSVDLQHEIEQLIDLEMDQQLTVEIEKEIELELTQYQINPLAPFLKEKPLELDNVRNLINALLSEPKHHEEIIHLHDQLKKIKYGLHGKFEKYQPLFNEPIFGTSAFFHTFANRHVLPIFHNHQRPAKQLLVVKSNNGELRWLLLSEFETHFVKTHLEKLYDTEPSFANVWLIQPDGSLLAKGEKMNAFPQDNILVQKGLVEINAFEGNVDYLDDESNREFAEKWLSQHTEDKIHFLKLKTFREPHQQQLLCTSSVITQALDKTQSKNKPTSSHFFSKKRLEWERNRLGQFKPDQNWMTKLLFNVKNISSLNSFYVPFLGLDPDLQDEDTKKAVAHLEQKEGLSSDALKIRAKELTQKQFNSLSTFQGPHLTQQQMRWVPIEKVQFITQPEQIHRQTTQADGNKTMDYLLTLEQVKGMDEKQAHLIPFVNPDFYFHFDQLWQIQAIPFPLIGKMNPEQGYMLSEKQVKGLTVEVLNNIKIVPGFLTTLFKTLTPDQIKSLNCDLLEEIPPPLLIHIQEKQIKEITNVQLIPKLEILAALNGAIDAGLWTSWVSAKMVPHLAEKQVQYLKNAEQIVQLLPEQIKYIQQEQVRHLRGDLQIQSIKDRVLFSFLTASQMASISNEQLSWITNQQVPDLTNEQLLKLSTNRSVEECKELFQHITEKQIQTFSSKELIKLISPDKLNHLNENYLFLLADPLQIQALTSINLIQKLNKLQFIHITAQQVKFLTSEQIGWMSTPKEFALLSSDQMTHVHGDHLEAIPSFQYVHITQKHIEEITNSLLISKLETLAAANVKVPQGLWSSWVLPKMVKFLAQHQIAFLIYPDQINGLSSIQIRSIDDEMTFRRLSYIQISQITDLQLKWITKEQVKGLLKEQLVKLPSHCPPEKVSEVMQHLTEEQISTFDSQELVRLIPPSKMHLIKEYQVSLLTEPEQIKALPSNQFLIKMLDKPQLIHVTASQSKYLTPRQIRLMNKPEEFSLLSPEQMKLVHGDNLENIPVSQYKNILEKHIKEITKKDLIPKLEKLAAMKAGFPKGLWTYWVLPKMVKFLAQHQINFLLNPDQINGLQPNQIRSIDDEMTFRRLSYIQISQISDLQLKWITKEQLKGLLKEQLVKIPSHCSPEKVSELMQHLTEEKISTFDSQELARLIPPSKMHLIKEQQVNLLTEPEQIKALPSNPLLIKMLNKAQLIHATALQAKFFTLRHISLMDRPEEFALLSPDQMKNVHGDRLEHIPKGQYIHINDKHIQEITKPDLIPKLETLAALNEQISKGLWTSWVLPKMVPFLDNHQISYLKSLDQINGLNWLQIQSIIDERTFRRLSYTQMKDIRDNQLKLITKDHVKGLSNEQLLKLHSFFPPENVRDLMQHLTELQIMTFNSEKLLSLIPPSKMHLIKEYQVSLLTEPEQIKALPSNPSLIKMLKKPQLIHVTASQSKHLTHGQIKLMNRPEEFSLLSPEQMKLVHGDNLEDMPVSQYNNILEKHIKEITKIELIPKLEKLAALQAGFPKGLWTSWVAPDKVQLLDDNQIPYLIGQAQIAQLSPSQIKHLTPGQVLLLHSSQLKHITPAQVPSLSDAQVMALPATKEFVEALEKWQLRYITPQQAKLLTAAQIGLMDCRKEIQQLEPEQWKHLSSEAIALLNKKEVITLLTKDELLDQIPHINPDYLKAVKNKKGISQLKNEQIDAFGSKRFNRLKDTHPLWKRITPKAVVGLEAEKVPNLAKKHLRYLEKPEAIRSISSFDIVHLTKEQLITRKEFKLIYVIAVLTLGVVACLISLIALLLLPIVGLHSEKARKKFRAILVPNIWRVKHVFTEYIAAASAA